ncbi:5-oxoprolinase subunit C family protein [Neobacillus dielmonensis]|uniref:5-oxoprolinase subunit C family protein n=1 Tax=Neobacillus dielmonensis TaxID=1347369 RepID=UPI0005A8660A|nr:biotin-dependent carboxyltransferase family protein [Neobacillus dielmonensis]
MKQPLFAVTKPGLQTTVQDLGRFGYQQYGISPSGAMDPYSMKIANILVGNDPVEAVLETAFLGPDLVAKSDMVVSICGGEFSLTVDGNTTPMWKSFLLKKGQTLAFGSCKKGARAYMAIAGGIDVPKILNSKSTFLNGKFGGFSGRSLKKDDIVYGHPLIRKPLKGLHTELIPNWGNHLNLRVIPGPHQSMFTKQGIHCFYNEEFVVTTKSNRMGYQLEGPRIEHVAGPDIISDPTPLGGIQVPASGQPIILMSDRQTTGGYARIGTVISTDIPLLAQAGPTSVIRFSSISVEEAHELYLKKQNLIKQFIIAAK